MGRKERKRREQIINKCPDNTAMQRFNNKKIHELNLKKWRGESWGKKS